MKYFLTCEIVSIGAGYNVRLLHKGIRKVKKCRLFHDVGVFDTQMGYKVDCTNISLTSIPTCDMLPVNCTLVFELYLNDNKIGILPPNGFIRFRNLQKVNLNGNPINKFENSSFQGLSKLETLVMCNVVSIWVRFELKTLHLYHQSEI